MLATAIQAGLSTSINIIPAANGWIVKVPFPEPRFVIGNGHPTMPVGIRTTEIPELNSEGKDEKIKHSDIKTDFIYVFSKLSDALDFIKNKIVETPEKKSV